MIEGHPESRVVLLCDHAGREVPGGLELLGISEEQLARHIGWDIGAADITRALAERLGATALLDHVSRLVIDPNRRPYTEASIPAVSDGCVVPGNHNLDRAEIRRRMAEYFIPYHRTVARTIGAFRRRGKIPVIIAVHSFTPRMNGEVRPWHVGILRGRDQRMAVPVLERLHAKPGLVIGDNQPYSGFRELGFTMAFHAQRARLPHLMLEVRQDEIATKAGALRYAEIIWEVVEESLADEGLYRQFEGDIRDDIGGRMSWRHASLASPLA